MHGCRHHRGKKPWYGLCPCPLLWSMVVHSNLGSTRCPLGAFYIIKRKVKCASTLALHSPSSSSLPGASLTHISAKRGMIHLRIGQPTDTYMAQDEEQGMKEEKLPSRSACRSLKRRCTMEPTPWLTILQNSPL